MAEGVLGLQLVLESQQHGDMVSREAGGTLGPCWVTHIGKIVPHCKHGHAIVALPVKIRPKSGVFTLLCMSDMMVLGSSKSWERRDRDAAEHCHCAVSFGGCLAETL